jgi:hypothetical protein
MGTPESRVPPLHLELRGVSRRSTLFVIQCVPHKGSLMHVDVFRGTGRMFAVIESGGANNLPEKYGPWSLFKTIELVRGQAQLGVDVDDCLDDIARHGIHVTDAHVRVTEQVIG